MGGSCTKSDPDNVKTPAVKTDTAPASSGAAAHSVGKKLKVLVIFAHPETKSFCAALKETIVSTFMKRGDEVKVSDLYRMKMILPVGPDDYEKLSDPAYFKAPDEQAAANKNNFTSYTPEVKAEHEKVKWSDVVIFVFPMYWCSFPGIMKCWIDRILSSGFAYGHGISLAPRKAMMVYTAGGPKELHESSGIQEAAWRLQNEGILKYCGFATLQPFVAYSATSVDDAKRKEYLKDLGGIMENIEKRAEYAPAGEKKK